jgi:hypothetical protein
VYAGDRVAMREHGYLSIEERRDVATQALARVVAPAARELFASLDHAWAGLAGREGPRRLA